MGFEDDSVRQRCRPYAEYRAGHTGRRHTYMKLDDIYIHDAKLRAVHEDCESKELVMDIDMPADEWSDQLVPRRLTLFEVKGYAVDEIMLEGVPTILEITQLRTDADSTTYRIDTNAGTRTLSITGFRIQDRESGAEPTPPGVATRAAPEK